jgi:hypothetical protein
MKRYARFTAIPPAAVLSTLLTLGTMQAQALALGEEEFRASRLLACVLAEESLGYLDQQEYGDRTHDLLDGFDAGERDAIYAKAVGYFDGLMFAIPASDAQRVNERLESFVSSDACSDAGVYRATVSL